MKIIAVDLGGYKIDFGIVENNKLMKVITVPTEADKGKDFVIKKVIENIFQLIGNDISSFDGIAIATPGPIDYKKGIVRVMVNLKGWKNVKLREIIEKKFRIKTKLDHDARCFALGNKKSGNMVAITLGTGVGSAVIINGRLFNGDISGTEIGHSVIVADGRQCNCGNKGCFEAYCSGTAIQKRYFELTNVSKTAKEIAEIRDKTSKQVLDETAHYLAIALNNIKNTFFPDVIVLGGSVSKCSYLIKKAINEMKRMPFESKVKIEVSKIEHATLLGAAKLFND